VSAPDGPASGDDLDAQNIGAAIAAQELRRIAETGRHEGVFGGADMEAAAQAILKIHRRADRVIVAAMRVQRKAEEETKRLLAKGEAPPAVVEALVRILVVADFRNAAPLPSGLRDALAEAVLALPDAAVLDLDRRCGRDPAETAARVRAIGERAIAEAKRARGAGGDRG